MYQLDEPKRIASLDTLKHFKRSALFPKGLFLNLTNLYYIQFSILFILCWFLMDI